MIRNKNIVKPLKILIAGSCVSRDPFGDNSNDKLRYVGYFARYSLARISYPSIKNRVLTEKEFCQRISSPFQRKILQQEWDNSLLDRIQQTEFDFLVVDCVDERFGLVEYSQGIYITNSDELKNAKVFDVKNAPKLHPNSQDFFDKWEEGLKSVVNAVGAEKIIINNVFWSNRLDTGEIFNLEKVKEGNEILSKLYLIARKYIPDNQFVNYPDNMFVGDSNHKWGKSPFHYKQEVYDYFTDFLSKLK